MPPLSFTEDAADQLLDHVKHAVMYQSAAQRQLLSALRLVDDAVADAFSLRVRVGDYTQEADDDV